MNVLITQPYRRAAQSLTIFDMARAHDIRVIMGVGNPLNRDWDYAEPGYPFTAAYRHSAVIAYKYGDEPKDDASLNVLAKQYQPLLRFYDHPVITAVVGEEMDFSLDSVALALWDDLGTEVRFARHYPFAKTV